jgi:hypothetical protein
MRFSPQLRQPSAQLSVCPGRSGRRSIQGLRAPGSRSVSGSALRVGGPDRRSRQSDDPQRSNRDPQGTADGIKPTSKRAQWAGISIDRIEHGKIVENWVSWDMMGMLQQLGVVSLPSREGR